MRLQRLTKKRKERKESWPSHNRLQKHTNKAGGTTTWTFQLTYMFTELRVLTQNIPVYERRVPSLKYLQLDYETLWSPPT